MLSVGTRDEGRKGVGLGFGRRVEMEENELEEGEASSYPDEDDSATDPDIALSYIGEKIQNVLGHFQKNFEGGLCAETMGATFGAYGSFLPVHKRSPCLLSQPKSPTKATPCAVAKPPHIAQPQAALPNKSLTTHSSDALRHKAIYFAQPLDNNSNNPSDLQHGLDSKSLNVKNARSFKVRIRLGSENGHAKNNASIYSDLGLDMSPSSSYEDTPDVNERTPHRIPDSPAISPCSTHKLYSCFQVSNIVTCLLSPISESLLHLVDKKTQYQKKCKPEENIPLRADSNKLGKSKITTGKSGLSEVLVLSDVGNVNCKVGGDNGNAVLENGGTDICNKNEITSSTQSGLKRVSDKSLTTVVSDGDKVSGVTNGPEISMSKERAVSHETVQRELCGNLAEKKTVGAGSEQLSSKNGLCLDTCPDGNHLLNDSLDFQNNGSKPYSQPTSAIRKDDEGCKGTENGPFKLKPPRKSNMIGWGKDSSSEGTLKSSDGKRKSKDGGCSNFPAFESGKGQFVGASVLTSKEKKKIESSKNDMVKSKQNALRPSKESNRPVIKEPSLINSRFKEDERGGERGEHIGDGIKHGNIDAHIRPAQTEYPKGRVGGKMVENVSSRAGKGSMATAAVGDFHSVEPVQPIDEWVCCDTCLKWRLLPFGATTANFPQKWICSMLDWLPGMNKCSISEDDTTKACKAKYEPLPANGHVALMGSQGAVQSGIGHTESQHHQRSSDFVCSGITKKKPILKDALDMPGQPPASVSANDVKPRQQISVKNKNLNDAKLSNVDSVALSKSCTLRMSKTHGYSAENHNSKKKEKHHTLDQYPDGGDSLEKNRKRSNSKSTRELIQGGVRTSKKIKLKESNHGNEDLYSNQSFGCKAVDGTSYPSKMSLKNHKGNSVSCASRSDLRDSSNKNASVQSVERAKGNFDVYQDMPGIPVKRKSSEWQENGALSGSDVQGEACETIRRKEKKMKLSKSECKESIVGKVGLKTDKGPISARVFNKDQLQNAFENQVDFDKVDQQNQKNTIGIGSLKKESVLSQPSTATSSSSKVSRSLKSKTRFPETGGSPIESVSSSPLKSFGTHKLTTKRNRQETGDTNNKIGNDSTGSKKRFDTRLFGCTDDEPSLSGGDDIDKGADAVVIYEQHGNNACSNVNGHCHRENELVSSLQQRKSGKISSSQTGLKHKNSIANDQCKMEMANSQPGSDFNVTSHVLCTELEDTRNYTNKTGKELKISLRKIGGKSQLANRESLTSSSVAANKEENGSYALASTSKDLNSKNYQNTMNSGNVEGCQMEEDSQMMGCKVDYDRFLTESVDKSSRRRSEKLPSIKGKDLDSQDQSLHDMYIATKNDMSDGLFVEDMKGHSKNHLKPEKSIENQSGRHDIILNDTPRKGLYTNSGHKKSPGISATNVIREARDLKHTANRIKNEGLEHESTALYFQAALKFLHGASLLESSSNDSATLGEMTSPIKMYTETAKLCEFCAHEYEKQKEIAAAALAFKCMEVAFMKVVYLMHALANKDQQELQAALLNGESPSSSASDVDNVHNQSNTDKMALDKINSTQVAGSHVIAAHNRRNFVRILSFAEMTNSAMDASKRSLNAFDSAAAILSESNKDVESLLSVRRVLDFSFHDIKGLLRLVRLSMECISR